MAGIHKAIEGALKASDQQGTALARGLSYINTNRDQLLRMVSGCRDRNAGFSDKTLAVLKFEDMNGKLIAALLNYCCHGTCAFTRKDVDGKIKTSPEFTGYACNYVQQRYGGDPCYSMVFGGCWRSESAFFLPKDFRGCMSRMDILKAWTLLMGPSI